MCDGVVLLLLLLHVEPEPLLACESATWAPVAFVPLFASSSWRQLPDAVSLLPCVFWAVLTARERRGPD